jgi:hypothetical protein
MVEQLVSQKRETQQRHHAASHSCLTTMTQQFGPADDLAKSSLPPGWIQMWDNPGNRRFFFNTLNHHIQYDVNVVMEKGALAAVQTTQTEAEDLDYFNDPILHLVDRISVRSARSLILRTT